MGEYVYYSADPGSPHDPDRLTLRADGKYTLVHVRLGRASSMQEGAWRLYPDHGTPTVELDHAGYPVRVQGEHVRLMIDYDLGQWYEKLR